MGQVFRESARHWLRTILETNVPVETGMAKATLLPVGRYLRNVGNLQINPRRKPYYHHTEGVVASPSSGIEKSSFFFEDDKTNPLAFIYTFEWTTSVLHYWVSGYYRQGVPGEVHLEKAKDAFDNFLSTTLNRRIPHFAEFILKG